jgi:hypothetical protein
MKIKLQDVQEEIDNIIDGVLVELIDDDFEIKKVFLDSLNHCLGKNTIDVHISKGNKKNFKISKIQPKVLTVVDFMKRRYHANVSYQTYDSKRELHTTFPLFKYNQIKKFKITITIK